jgi:hypothetical protein
MEPQSYIGTMSIQSNTALELQTTHALVAYAVRKSMITRLVCTDCIRFGVYLQFG